MRMLTTAALVCAAISSPAKAEPNLERGFAGALRGCEEWVLNPAIWTSGTGPFLAMVGLGEQMGLVDQVDEVSLPPRPLRRANRYWRINSTLDAGFILVVSDDLPMCHITGGGSIDLQPSVEAVLSSAEFSRRWNLEQGSVNNGMTTTVFRHREAPQFSMMVSRAERSGERLDLVQVLATAMYRVAN